MSELAYFLLKITIAPVLVAGMSLASRRWGPTTTAVLMSLPWMTGPVLYFLSLEKGPHWAAAACTGIEIGTASIAVWVCCYLLVGRHARWPSSVAAAIAGFWVAGLGAGQLMFSLESAAALAISLHLAGYLMTRPPPAPGKGRGLPWWDIPARMLATAALVTAVTLAADRLGPRLSGIAATYPVIVTIVTTFTHHQWGIDVVVLLLRALLLSMISFSIFFLVIGWTIVPLGSEMSFALAVATATTTNALILLVRRRTRRNGKPAAALRPETDGARGRHDVPRPSNPG